MTKTPSTSTQYLIRRPGRRWRQLRPSPARLAPSAIVIVVDMTNDFAQGRHVRHARHRPVRRSQAAVGPTSRVLAAGRAAGVPVVYMKHAFRPDLSDVGLPGSLNVRHGERWGVGKSTRAPDGTESRILIRDTWNTDIIDALAPGAGDTLLLKTRFSAFYETDLHRVLRSWGVRNLVLTGCTTTVCVESTLRDAAFRDYNAILLEDCTAGQRLSAQQSRSLAVHHRCGIRLARRLISFHRRPRGASRRRRHAWRELRSSRSARTARRSGLASLR